MPPSRTGGPPPFAEAFAHWLDTPGPPFSEATPVRLEDTFTAPVLVLADEAGRPWPVAADPMGVALSTRRLLVSGPERIGRTTFAKRIVRAAHARGDTPVYARGSVFRGDYRPTAVVRQLAELAREQYGVAVTPDVVVLDDLDGARLVGERGAEAVGRRSVLRAVETAAKRVVAFTVEHDLATRLRASDDPGYTAAFLGSFGPEPRAELAARFAQAIAPQETWRSFLGPTRHILEALFGTGRVPSFPYYVLVALGELYTGAPAHIDGAAYGQYYEMVVHETAKAARASQKRSLKR